MFSFRGTTGRLAYFGFQMLAFVTMLMGGGLASASTPNAEEASGVAIVVLLAFFVPATWIALAASVRRCHDLGKSGWFILTTAIPLVGFVFGLYLLFGAPVYAANPYRTDNTSSARDVYMAQFHPA